MTRRTATLLGIAAILVWSTNSAATITLVRHLGPLTSLALVSLLAGGVLAVIEDARRGRAGSFLRIGLPFAALGGICFLTYQLLFFAAFAMADPAMSMQLNLVNYLWPTFTVVLGILHHRARYRLHPLWLALGLAAGLAGIALSLGGDASVAGLRDAVARCPAAFLAMLAAAVAWAVYSAVAVPLHRPGVPGGTALFFLLVAVVAGVGRFAMGERSTFVLGDAPVLLYSALAPSAGAYLAWELGMRHGDVPLLGSLSNALPLLSTLVLVLMLGSDGDARLCFGATLVCAGALLVHRGARSRTDS